MRSGILIVLASLVGSSTAAAQSFLPIGEAYLDVSAAVPFNQKVLVYKPYKDDQLQLYLTPFFAFKEAKPGVVDVVVEPPLPGQATARLKLKLLVSPTQVLEEVAAHIRRQEEQKAVLPRFKDVLPSHLICIPFLSYAVKQESGNNPPLFLTKEQGEVGSPRACYDLDPRVFRGL